MAAARIGGYRKPLLAGHEELLGRASTPHWSQPRSCAALRSYILLRIVLTASPPRSVALCVTSTVAQKQYLEAGASQGSARSKLCEAIRYPLLRWSGLTFFIDDGRIDLNQYRRALNPSVCAQPVRLRSTARTLPLLARPEVGTTRPSLRRSWSAGSSAL
jgi:hypothetical protein